MAPRYTFLINRRSGAGTGNKIAKVLMRVLARHPVLGQDAAEVFMLDESAETELKGVVSQSERIFLLGGDGTVSRFIPLLLRAEPRPAVGLLPIGTSNDLARALGASVNADYTDERVLQETVDRLATGRPFPLDIFCVNDQLFFCNYFSVGLDAAIVCDFDKIRESRFARSLPRGRFTNNALYFFMGLKNAGFRLAPPIAVSIERSGKREHMTIEHPIRSIIASNLPVYAGGCRICPDARTDDGLFEIALVQSAFQYILLIATRFIPFLRLPRGIARLRGERAEIRLSSPAPFQIDGERGPASFRAEGRLDISRSETISLLV